MFLKRERPKTDDFVIKKISGFAKNTKQKFREITEIKVLADTLTENSDIFLCIFLRFKTFQGFFLN